MQNNRHLTECWKRLDSKGLKAPTELLEATVDYCERLGLEETPSYVLDDLERKARSLRQIGDDEEARQRERKAREKFREKLLKEYPNLSGIRRRY